MRVSKTARLSKATVIEDIMPRKVRRLTVYVIERQAHSYEIVVRGQDKRITPREKR